MPKKTIGFHLARKGKWKLGALPSVGAVAIALGFLGLSIGIASRVREAVAQEAIEVNNAASATFQPAPGAPVPPAVTSNEVTFAAEVSPATLEIIKSGDRQAAEPGDISIYRISVTNTSNVPIENLVVRDEQPFGFEFLPDSLEVSLVDGDGGSSGAGLSDLQADDRTISFSFPRLEPDETLELVYASVLTPDAIRGNGRNTVAASGNELDGGVVASNVASFRVQVRPGILTDCGTIVGRVFVDRNFDGEQQPGEPGVPNAVIYMDDGNLITTDRDGLFSLGCVISGYRSATLDLSRIPGYTIAPNLYRIEKNSLSRLVRLEPGGLVRMNFAVTPAFDDDTSQEPLLPDN